AAQQIVVGEQALNLRLKRFRLGQIDDADGATANLVFIGRANAALGRADLEARIGAFAHGIEIAVDGEDERGIFGNAQHVRIDVDALRAQFLDFGNEMMWIDNDAVADDAQLAAYKAGWQQRKLVADAVDDQRMTC